MKTYLQAFDLWEAVNTDIEPAALRANLTIALMRQHSEKCEKKHKEISCLQKWCVMSFLQ